MRTWVWQPVFSFRSKPLPGLPRMFCRHAAIWVFCLLILVLPDYAQQISVFVTSKAGDRLANIPTLRFRSAIHHAKTGFWVDDSITYQRIDGFGASFLEAGAICLRSLEPAAKEAVLQALFDARQGAGFSAMKTVIGATDFMSTGPYYT